MNIFRSNIVQQKNFFQKPCWTGQVRFINFNFLKLLESIIINFNSTRNNFNFGHWIGKLKTFTLFTKVVCCLMWTNLIGWFKLIANTANQSRNKFNIVYCNSWTAFYMYVVLPCSWVSLCKLMMGSLIYHLGFRCSNGLFAEVSWYGN